MRNNVKNTDKVIRILLIFTLFILISACLSEKKNNTPNLENQAVNKIEDESYIKQGKELFKNVEFRNWKTNAKPTNWDINENFEKPELHVIDRDTLDLMIKGHKDELVYIKQKLEVEPNTYYVFEGNVKTRLKHGSYTGITITNNEKEIIGKKIFVKAGIQNYKVVFNSKDSRELICYIGFLSEGEGEIMIKLISLKKVKLNNSIFESEIAQSFHNTLELEISNGNEFDKSVAKIIKNVSTLLLFQQDQDSMNLELKENIISSLDDASYFRRILLEQSKKNRTKSFATKIVFGSNEILDEFNIGSRIIEFHENKKRIHLALLYYNPFLNEWVTIDPFYNSKITTKNELNLVNKQEIYPIEYGGLISNNVEILIKKYAKSKTTIIKEKVIGFPF